MTNDHSPEDRDPAEVFEAVPWESLTAASPRPDRFWIVVAAAAIAAVAGIAFLRGATAPAAPGAGLVVTPSTSPPLEPAPTVPDTTSTEPPTVIGEADLMAVDPMSFERLAASVAEEAVVAYFSADTSTFWPGVDLPAGAATVGSARALTVTRTASDRMDVLVAVSLVDQGEGSGRWPSFGVLLPLGIEDGIVRPLDLPSPATLPVGGFVEPIGVDAAPLPQLVAVATAAITGASDGIPELLSYRVLPDGTTRLVLSITDARGDAWPMSVVVAPDGTVVRPG